MRPVRPAMPMGGTFPHLNVDERALAKLMHEQKYSVGKVAAKLRADRELRGGGTGPTVSAVSRLLSGVTHRYDKQKPKGRKRKTTKKQDRALISTLRRVRSRTAGEVPVRVVQHKSGLDGTVGERTVRRRFNEAGYFSLAPRRKPEQTPEDCAKREVFARLYRAVSKRKWRDDWAYCDCKRYAAYTSKKGREYTRAQAVRRVWRKKTEGTAKGCHKPGFKHRRGTGKVSRVYFALIARGKVQTFHWVKGRMSKKVWAKILKKVVKPKMDELGLTKLLRDGDPTSFGTKYCRKIEEKLGLEVTQLPPRSPDLNPCDFSLWAAIRKIMRAYEDLYLGEETEKEEDFWTRLETSALGLSSAVVYKMCGSMHGRVSELTRNGGAWLKRD